VDLIAIGPTDLSRALGVLGQMNHPLVREAIEKVAETLKRVGNARLSLPLRHAVLDLDVPQLIELGVGYTNCAPGPEVRLLRSYQEQVARIKAKRPQ
jgi:2-keto-3-deoxy-L-rhamnonate aldolase RhmA